MKILHLATELKITASDLVSRLKAIGLPKVTLTGDVDDKMAVGIKDLFAQKISEQDFQKTFLQKESSKATPKRRTRKKADIEAASDVSVAETALPAEQPLSDGLDPSGAEPTLSPPKKNLKRSPLTVKTDSAELPEKSTGAAVEESAPLKKADNKAKPSKAGISPTKELSAVDAKKGTESSELPQSEPTAPAEKKAAVPPTRPASPGKAPQNVIIKRVLKKNGEQSSAQQDQHPDAKKKYGIKKVEDDQWDAKGKLKAKPVKKERLKLTNLEGEDDTADSDDNVIIRTVLKKQHRHEVIRKKEKHVFAARKKDIFIGPTVTVSELAGQTGIRSADLIKSLMQLGHMVTINEYISGELAQLIASEHNINILIKENNVEDALKVEEDRPEDLQVRPPVVTIMGHVDHGKTSLLDFIRKTNVLKGEAGGITQHIGAYFVKSNSGDICFLDTPGHAAFTAMRARGANATDIVILIVAADDGPMPQTVEAINHAKAADVPIIVAINKCDKPDADVPKTTQKLMEHGLISEEFGGDTTMVQISAKTGKGVKDLLEMINLQADLLELKANPKRAADGLVIESKIDRGHGIVATLLVQNGTLNKGDYLVVGSEYGRVRALINELGKNVDSAGPSVPIKILGLNGVPKAGDRFQVNADEKTVKAAAQARKLTEKEEEAKKKQGVSLENFFAEMKEGEKSILNLIIKGDVIGSVEAISESLQRIGNDKVGIKILHASVGAISNSDVTLAAAGNAMIIGFNVRPDSNAKKMAENESISIKMYNVIYNIMDDIKNALEGMLDPVIREDEVGKANVLEIFNITGIGLIAGCKITEGKAAKEARVRVLRDNIVVRESTVTSLRRFKDDVKEVLEGFECGIGLEHAKEVLAGDTLEFFNQTEESGKL